ncbi:MAG: hypothetical protein IJC59_03580 [Lachnospiraceae bacterium]|nr:hypothetical protein [Lachnospiraceae bacterium]
MKQRKISPSMVKRFFSVAAAAVLTALLCMAALFGTSLIPQAAIAEGCLKSAEFFYEEELFPYLLSGQFNTRQDHYADCILVNILYHIEEEAPISSPVTAAYYHGEKENVNDSLYAAVKEEKEPNVDYFRYWHGSMALLRPLFLFTDIQGARLLLGGLLLLMTLLASWAVAKRGERVLAVSYLAANVILQMWMCGFCIEYITTPLVANGILLVLLHLYDTWGEQREEMDHRVGRLMAVSGVLTCFVDFLTTETLTVTLPLLFLLLLRFRDGRLQSCRKEMATMAAGGLIWGLSYGGMFLLKWGIASALLGREALLGALSSAGERIAGIVHLGSSSLDPEATAGERLLGALAYNWGSLFPFREEMRAGAALVFFFGLLFLCFAIIYLFRGKDFSGKTVVLCLLLSCVPYLRYMTLSNHSYLHYFFTYRAQLVGITALCYCTWRFGLSGLWGLCGFCRKKN